MNILLINQWYPPEGGLGGVVKYNYYITNAYKKLGHRVFVISKLIRGDREYQDKGGIYIFRVKQIGVPWFFLKVPYLGSMLRFLRDLIYSFSVYRKLKALNRRYKIDIVEYAEINSESFFHSIFSSKSIPFIVRCHTPYFILKRYYLKLEKRVIDNPLIFWMEKFCIKRANFITTPSKDLARIIRKELKTPLNKIEVVPNGIDVNKFCPIDLEKHRDGEIILLFVGRIERAKGVFIMGEAFCKLVKVYKDKIIKCVFVGEDRGALTKLKSMLKKGGVIPHVEFRGVVSEEELVKIYQQTDIFINPSLIYESFSYTCLEAMASGVPVIASRIGGIPEVVEDGKTGFLFEPGEVDDLIEKLKILIEDPDKRRKMGKGARKRVEEHFDVCKVAKRNLEIYKSYAREI